MKTQFFCLSKEDPGLWISQLSREELQEFSSFQKEEERQRRKTARAILKRELAQQLGISPHNLCIQKSKAGKPFLPHHPELHFNISHSGDWLALVMGEQECGIDIEEVRPLLEREAIQERVFSLAERKAIRDIQNPLQGFYQAWTRKEALLKAVGCGFSVDPRTVCSIAMTESEGWEITELTAPESYMAAMGTKRGLRDLCRRRILASIDPSA